MSDSNPEKTLIVRDAAFRAVRGFLARQTWTFAKTYARKAPHEYIVRGRAAGADEEFLAAADYIRSEGQLMYFWNHPNRYVYLDGRYYWVMSDGEDDPTMIINRSRAAEYKVSIAWRGPEERTAERSAERSAGK